MKKKEPAGFSTVRLVFSWATCCTVFDIRIIKEITSAVRIMPVPLKDPDVRASSLSGVK